MAAAESEPEDLRRVAERCVPGYGAVDIDRLGSGLVNRSYRVSRDGRFYSLRLAAPQAAEIGLDREWECRVLRRAAEAGLAPPVEYCDPRAGILVARWAEGGCWSADQARSAEAIERVAALARRVHALAPPSMPRVVDAAQWIDFYRAALERRGGRKRRERPERASDLDAQADAFLAAAAREPRPAAVLCHGDLHVQNLVIAPDAEPVILDWEYAHVADPRWDLVGWASNGDLAPEQRDLLLASYWRRATSPEETAGLGRLAWLFDYVCSLWGELYLRSVPAEKGMGEAVAARTARLTQRLREGIPARF